MDMSMAEGVASVEPRLVDLVTQSCQIVTIHQHESGAFPASPYFPAYNFCWFRDGSFVAEGLSRHGEVGPAEAFHRWCSEVLRSRSVRVDRIVEQIRQGLPVERDTLLPTRYTLEGEEAGDDWWNFQVDGYGSWLWSLCAHLRRHHGDPRPYREAVDVAVSYLMASWELPCYDWWEEHPEDHHVSTLGAIAAGIAAVLELGLLDDGLAAEAAVHLDRIRSRVKEDGTVQGHLVKWLGGEAVDGSLLACLAPFTVVDEATATATLERIEQDLVLENGVFRYVGDTFYGGGRWPLLTGFLGLARLRLGRRESALAALEWIASAATASSEFPEQVSAPLQHPERFDEWLQRWGPIATPLLWSHGMYLILADELGLHA